MSSKQDEATLKSHGPSQNRRWLVLGKTLPITLVVSKVIKANIVLKNFYLLSVSPYVLPSSFALSPHRILKEHAVVEEPYKVWHFLFIHIPSNLHSALVL